METWEWKTCLHIFIKEREYYWRAPWWYDLNEHFDDQDSKNSFYTIYNEIFKLEHDHNTAIRDSIADVFHKSEATFAELKESKEKEQLQQFAFITLLGYDIYLRKQVIEKMIDELYQPESNNKAEKKKKK